MKVVQIHNVYQTPGGEDRVVERERELLTRAGHTVVTLVKDNDAIRTPAEKLTAAWHLPYSKEAAREVGARLDHEQPDVVHLHNTFPLWTDAVAEAAHIRKIPVVKTLHNFRAFCANSLFLRDGKPCTLCLHGSKYQSVRYACYRGSRLASLAVARLLSDRKERERLFRNVSRFIVLSEFARKLTIEGGFPEEKLVLKPGFSEDPGDVSAPSQWESFRFLFVGRISEEKGLGVLLNAWKEYQIGFPRDELVVIGDGPLRATLERNAPTGVRFNGFQAAPIVAKAYQSCHAVVFPSQCFENFPLAIAEASSFGRPVLASDIGSIPEMLDRSSITPAGDISAWCHKLKEFRQLSRETWQERSHRARQRFLSFWTPSDNLKRLLEIYQNVQSLH